MEKLEKNWKQKMAAALALGAASPGPNDALAQQPATVEVRHQKPTTVEAFKVPEGQHPRDKFLGSISQLESSGGKYLNHKPSYDPIHQGDQAIGKVALMPKTVKDIGLLLNTKSSPLMQRLGEHYKDEEFSELASLPESHITEKLKQNPELYTRGARYLAEHLHSLHGGDKSRMAWGWRFGHRQPPSKIEDRHLKDSGYVKKFHRYFNPEDK